jgi:hypothetical protein
VRSGTRSFVVVAAFVLIACGVVASSASATKLTTDCSQLLPYTKIKQHFALPKLHELFHAPMEVTDEDALSSCSVVAFRGREVPAYAWGKAIASGRAVGVLLETFAVLGSPCAGEERETPCPETQESQFQSGLAGDLHLLGRSEGSAITVPKFGAEGDKGIIVCRQKVCGILVVWWSTVNHAMLYVKLGVSRPRPEAIKSLNTLVATAVSSYFG